jgi:predicted Fe-Mo cluster-binding NifX family protein
MLCALVFKKTGGEKAVKIALATWNGRISPVFDVSRQLLVIDVEDGRVVNRVTVHFSSDHPVHKVQRLLDMKVDVLLCGAVSRQMAAVLDAHQIKRQDFIAGDIEEVTTAFLRGALPNAEMSMPGCFSRRNRRRAKNRRGKRQT